MSAYRHLGIAQHSRDYTHLLLAVGILSPQQLFWQSGTELPMQPQDVFQRSWFRRPILLFIDLSLKLDVRHGFKLQCATFGLGCVIRAQSAIDVTWVSVMPFDQVRVIAVHRSNQSG